MSDPIIRAEKVTKIFSRKSLKTEILREIDLVIHQGERVSILGSSGAGKSTLLHLLGGLDLPTKGEIFVHGKKLSSQTEKELAQFRNRVIGFVFQFHYLLPLFNTLENIMIPCLIARVSRKEATEKAFDLLSQVGLSHRSHHYPSELSGGEQQRVALARALVMEPEIVMADEPTGNLDTKNSEQVFDLLLQLNERKGTTLIVVTHNEKLADRLNRKVWISDGKVIS